MPVELLAALRFYLILTLCGVLGYPLARRLWGARLSSFWLAKPLGLLLIAFPVWLAASFGLLDASRDWPLYTLLPGGCGASIFFAMRREPWPLLERIARYEAFGFAVYALYLYVRSLNPAIQGTEKYMDMALLTAAAKTSRFPFADPWWAEKPVNYYYYGYWLLAIPLRLARVPYAIAYHCSLGWLLVQSLAGMGALLRHFQLPRGAAVLGAWLMAASGTLAYTAKLAWAWLRHQPPPNYAASARYYDPSYIINEIPSYSFTVGDLHAHLIALPFFLLNLALAARWTAGPAPPLWQWLLAGFTVASSALINSWDGITLALVFALVVSSQHSAVRAAPRVWLGRTAAAGLAAMVVVAPFLLHFKSPAAGVGFAPAFAVAHGILGMKSQYPTPPLLWIGMWGLPLAALALAYRRGLAGAPFLFGAAGVLLTGAVELFFMKDLYHIANPPYFRANTVFKFGFHAWVLLTAAMMVSLAHVMGRSRRLSWIWAALLVHSLVFPVVAGKQFFQIPGWQLPPFGTINGAAFLERGFEEDAAVIRWINRNVPGRPVLAEAVGESYSPCARIGAFTGLPNPINWKSHEWGWRFEAPRPAPPPGTPVETGYGAVARVAADIAALYESRSLEETRAILKRYAVEYVYVGPLERQTYPSLWEDKFRQLGRQVFAHRGARLFRVL